MRLRFLRNRGDHDHPVAEIWIQGGHLQSDKPGFAETILKEGATDHRGARLKPSEGDAFLQAVHQRYGRGSYMRTEIVEGKE